MKEELWYNPYRDQLYFVYPACNCHKFSYIISLGNKFYENWSIDFEGRSEFRKYMKSYGRIKL